MEFLLRLQPSQKVDYKISWIWVWKEFETVDVAGSSSMECRIKSVKWLSSKFGIIEIFVVSINVVKQGHFQSE
jgi:hypothetical protein